MLRSSKKFKSAIALCLALVMAVSVAAPALAAVSKETAAAELQVYTAIEKEVDKAKTGETVYFDKVRSLYETNLKANVTAVNKDIDNRLDVIIRAGENKELDAKVAGQVIKKSLLGYFYDQMKNELKKGVLDNFDNTAEALKHFEAGKAYYESGLKSTVVKRDEKYQTTMADELNALFSAAEKAIKDKNLLEYKIARQYIEKTVFRAFYLGVLTYAEKIEKSAEPAKMKPEQAEGWAFYQAIKGSLSSGNAKAAELIENRFALDADPAKIKLSEINHAFAKAFIGKADGYFAKIFGADWGTDKAVEQAAEAVVFVKNFSLVIKEYLGEEAYNSVDVTGAAFVEAVKAKKHHEAMAQADKLAKLFVGVKGKNGLVLTINSKKVKAGGGNKDFDAAPFTVNGRTLVPVRLLEELGAKIEWNNAKQTVTITKGSDVVVLTINSTIALKNGSSITLDAKAVLKDKRTFVPVRFVSETLGYTVDWYGNSLNNVVIYN